MSTSKKAIVTDEHREEARALREIWNRVRPKNQKEFGAEFGIGGQTAVSNFLSGTSALSLKAAAGFAAGLGCRIEDFSPRLAAPAAQIAELTPPPPPSSDEYTSVRHANVRFANGSGKVAYVVADKPAMVFRTDFLKRAGVSQANAVVVDAVGHSNEPRIPDGSLVLVNRGDKERLNGEFFAFRADGELLIKRLQDVPGAGVLAIADNPSFKPKQVMYREGDDFEVIGRVVWAGIML